MSSYALPVADGCRNVEVFNFIAVKSWSSAYQLVTITVNSQHNANSLDKNHTGMSSSVIAVGNLQLFRRSPKSLTVHFAWFVESVGPRQRLINVALGPNLQPFSTFL